MKKAIIFGATGQAGSYLKEFLLSKGYLVRALTKEECDFRNPNGTLRFEFSRFKPDEIYNFAGRMYAPDSWGDPAGYTAVNGISVLYILETMCEICPEARFFNAGSAEVFDKRAAFHSHSEVAPRNPDNPYGAAKWYAEEIVRIYREQKSLFACTGVFFNMESPRRAKTFFAQKVVSEAVRLACDKETIPHPRKIGLGRLDAVRDWGWAPEYVIAAHRMLQPDFPTDYVIGTGESHTCKEFVLEALKCAGLPDPAGRFDEYVEYDKTPGPFSVMRADTRKIERDFGWRATVRMKEIVKRLVEAEKLSVKSPAPR